MQVTHKPEDPKSIEYLKDHLSNERSFLAWIRTCLGVMAFGFVVERFGFFIREILKVLKKLNVAEESYNQDLIHSSSFYFGLALIVVGVVLCFLAYVKFRKVTRQIESGIYKPTLGLDFLVMLTVCAIGIFLLAALFVSANGS